MKKTETVARGLDTTYPSWKVEKLAVRKFSPESFLAILDGIIERCPNVLASRELGRSFEGRPIRSISAGAGGTKVLLWSQMHGDESTATMAIADILNYFALHPDDGPAQVIRSSLHLLFLPMLNPDGAARFQRRTAQHIDMNRDALALQTPEARILKNLHEELKPDFGFNLHDQELSTVGTSKNLTAIALLAPATNGKKSDNQIHRRAKHLAAFLVESINLIFPHKVARYDDTFELRAFGDNMQRWGTSTLLIESGHIFNDPEKQFIRRLNAVGILAGLHAIATGEYARADVSLYESLPFNGKQAYDLLIRNIRVQHSNGELIKADLGISYQVDTHTEETPVLADIGDLHTFVGLREIDGGETALPERSLLLGKPFPWPKFFPQ